MLYRLGAPWPSDVAAVEAALDTARFVPCGASQEKAVGWLEPRGIAHGPLVEVIGGQWLFKLMMEMKVVPGSVVKRKVEEQVPTLKPPPDANLARKRKRN